MICKEKGYEILDSETAQEDLAAEHTGPRPESALSSRPPGLLGLHHLLPRSSHCIAGFLMGIFSPGGICTPSQVGAEPTFSPHLLIEGVNDE